MKGYYIARIFLQFPNLMFSIALPLHLLQATNRLGLSGVFFSLINIPSIFLNPLLGKWIENKDLKKVGLGIIPGSILLYLIYIVFPERNNFFFLLFFSIFLQIFSNCLDTITKVIFGTIVEADHLEKENGLKSVIDNVLTIIAPVVGTVLYGNFGFLRLAALNFILYVIAMIAFISIPYSFAVHDIEKSSHESTGELKAYFFSKKDILCLCALTMSLNFFVANSDEIIYPGILVSHYKISETLYGFANTALILGTLMAGFYIYKFAPRLRQNLLKFFSCNSLLMLLQGFLGLVIPVTYKYVYYVFFIISQLIIGVITTCINVPIISYYQENIPLMYQSRFFSFTSSLYTVVFSLGTLAAGTGADFLNASIMFIINNAAVLIIIRIAAPIYNQYVIVSHKNRG